MYRSTFKVSILVFTVFAHCLLPLSASDDKGSGILAGISAAWVFPTYNEPMDTTLNDIVDLGGYYRLHPGFGIELGYGFYRDLYIIAGYEKVQDFIEESLLLKSSFYYLGFRNYPFQNGFVFEAKWGPCSLYYDSSIEGSETSDTGSGFALTFAYDFGKTTEGLSFETGINLNYLTDMKFDESSDAVSARQKMLYGKILWK